jgi:uncharacterized membrane protein YfcA
MEALSAPELVFFAVVIVLSYSIRGSAGFGGVTVPLLALIISLKTLAPTVAFLGLISSLVILRNDWRHVVWRDLWPILPWCGAGVAAGLYFFKTLDARTLGQALGGFILFYGGYSLWTTFRRPRPLRLPVRAVTPLAGTVAGFVGTIFGSNAGAFFAIYLDLLQHAKTEFRATVAAILLALGILRVSGYVAIGAYGRDALIACAAAVPLMAFGAFLGNRIHASLDQLRFQRLVAAIMIASGVPLVLR